MKGHFSKTLLPLILALLIIGSAAGETPAAASDQALIPSHTIRVPELIFDGPESMAGQVTQLQENFDRGSMADIVTLLGLEDPGPPIHIWIAPEGSYEARLAPSWGVAYAMGSAGRVVLIPSRVPGYPDRRLETVLRHEIAHVLIARAAKRRPVPRWFNEGLAMVAAREVGGFEDRTRLVLATFRRQGALRDLDELFHAGSHSASHGYALSAAFVRHLLDVNGPKAAGRVLHHLGSGLTFEQAFRQATGQSLNKAEARFWQQLDLWNKWLPFLSSSTTLWLAITLLALVAFKRRRDKDKEQLERWDEEEKRQLEATITDGWVH